MKKLKAVLEFIQIQVLIKTAFNCSILVRYTGCESISNPKVTLAVATTTVDVCNGICQASPDGARVAERKLKLWSLY